MWGVLSCAVLGTANHVEARTGDVTGLHITTTIRDLRSCIMPTMTDSAEMTQESELSENLHHGAHVRCQLGSPFVTLACGRVANWDEQADSEGEPLCPLCWNADECPICGAHLVKP